MRGAYDVPMKTIGRFAQARALARKLFPTWSRSARARWVRAKLAVTPQSKTPISTAWSHDMRAYRFERMLRA